MTDDKKQTLNIELSEEVIIEAHETLVDEMEFAWRQFGVSSVDYLTSAVAFAKAHGWHPAKNKLT